MMIMAGGGKDHRDVSGVDVLLGWDVWYCRKSSGTPTRSMRATLLLQLWGGDSRSSSLTGISSEFSVNEASVWQ